MEVQVNLQKDRRQTCNHLREESNHLLINRKNKMINHKENMKLKRYKLNQLKP